MHCRGDFYVEPNKTFKSLKALVDAYCKEKVSLITIIKVR